MRRLCALAALGCLVACGKIAADSSLTGVDGSAGQGGSASGAGGSIGGTAGATGDASAVVDGAMSTEGSTADRPGAEPVCSQMSYETTTLRRLNNWEYERTVLALTGLATTASFPFEQTILAPFVLGGPMTPVFLEEIFFEAERQGIALGGTAVVACQGMPSATCGKAWVTNFVARAFRRPLTEAESLRYGAMFDAGLASMDLALGVSFAATEALISPNFLYKISLGETAQGAVAPLTQFEIATKLSYFLLGGPPDSLLDEAAASGRLGSAAERASQAGRLFDQASFNDVARRFHEQWLGLDGLASRVGNRLTQAQVDSMRVETLKFIDYVFKEGGHKVSALLTVPIGFVDANLASIYGVPDSNGLATQLNPLQRAGVLTLASTMARHSNPTERGMFLRDRLLCDPVPPPPPIDLPLVTVNPGQTRRQAWQQAMAEPRCAGCHNLIDTLGFGFEHYDETGAYRTVDNGLPVDARGEIVSISELSGPFDGAIELASKLSGGRAVFNCLARQWITALNQRAFDEQLDSCLHIAAFDALAASGGDLRQMLIAIVSNPSFQRRRALPKVNPAGSAPAIGDIATQAIRRKVLLDLSMFELVNLQQQVPPEDQVFVDAHRSAARDLQRLLASR